MMLCSKLHCQKFLKLKSFSYKIAGRHLDGGCGLLPQRNRQDKLQQDVVNPVEPFHPNAAQLAHRTLIVLV